MPSVQTVGPGSAAKLQEARKAQLVDPCEWDGLVAPENVFEAEAYSGHAIAVGAIAENIKAYKEILPCGMSLDDLWERYLDMKTGPASECTAFRLSDRAGALAGITVSQVFKDTFGTRTAKNARTKFAKDQVKLRRGE